MPTAVLRTPITVPPLPPVAPPPYLTVKYHRVTVTITDQVAQTKVDQVFVNDYTRDLEGTYIFPLPEDATISNFVMYVDGKKMDGKILTKEEARRIYEETVSSRRDPALLEYIGRGAFQASVYPIPAKGERRIQIEYTQVLGRDNGLVRYVYPLATEKFSARPLQQLSVHVSITGKEAIKAIYSSSHDVAVTRQGDFAAEASYEAANVRPDKDFVLYYGLAQGDIGASLLTYRQSDEDGYFLLLVTPRTEVDTSKIAAKDVILVLDTSGSMQGQKIEQAKQALRFILDRLNSNDRFALISFNTSVTRLREGLLTTRDREAAHRFVDGLNAAGSTNINDALLEAVRGLDAERPTVIIFLTDGLPTIGVIDTGRIVDNVGKVAPKNVRLFTFGVGYDVNTSLLDTLAANHRGVSSYVKPGENLEEPVSAFYAMISRPMLTDLTLDFGGVRVADLYPTPLPDLFAGGQLVLTGRYRGAGPTTITLKGMVNNNTQSFAYGDIVFPQQTGSDTAFVARLWATRRIGYLVTQIRLHGTNKEVVDEIVSLGLRYGIVTPYTSFLVDERQNVLAPGGEQKASESLGRSLAAPAPSAGATAVQDSQALRSLREAPSAAAPSQAQTTLLRTVADKTFLLREGVWVDTQYREGVKTVDVGFASADYFALLAARPEWGKYFAVGDKVIVLLDGVAYRVAEGQFAAIAIPPTPTAVATGVTPQPSQPGETIGFFSRLWQWLMGMLGR
jgi:Ca-activated chloride channel family protein